MLQYVDLLTYDTVWSKNLDMSYWNVTQSFPDNGTNSSQTMWKNELHDNDKIKFEWYFKTIHLFYVKFSHVKYYI